MRAKGARQEPRVQLGEMEEKLSTCVVEMILDQCEIAHI